MIDHGITICISPLLALMKNQVAALEASNIAVASINSTISLDDRDEILEDLRCGHPRTRLLYVTPEYCRTATFRRHLNTIYSQGELARIAIDEAHCISDWGHDFRPSFLDLSYFRITFPKTPIICLTATATSQVRDSVISTLRLNPSTLKIFTTTTSRPNLHFEVRFTSDEDDIRFSRLVSFLRGVHSRRSNDPTRKTELESSQTRLDAFSGIIYTSTRAECEALASRLKYEGLGAAPFHAGLGTAEKTTCQTKWLANEVGYDIIVATIAFGMGIDKTDVRFVVHWNMPKSFEGFYQEAGRAGRDGKASLCLLFYSREDRDRTILRVARDAESKGRGGPGASEQQRTNQKKSRTESFQKLVEYCESTNRCRHGFIAEFFGEDKESTRCDFACDWCKDAKGLKRRKKDGLATEEFVSTQNYAYDGQYDSC